MKPLDLVNKSLVSRSFTNVKMYTFSIFKINKKLYCLTMLVKPLYAESTKFIHILFGICLMSKIKIKIIFVSIIVTENAWGMLKMLLIDFA